MQSELVPVGDVRLHVNRWEGPADRAPFLLVHGLASNAHMWDGVAEQLAGRGHAVVAVDQRGHGRSDKPDDTYEMGAFVADLVAMIDALGLDRPIAAGQSFGGNVVLDLAATSPAHARGVIGVDGATIELRRRFPTWEDCARHLAPPKTEGRRHADIERMMRAMHADWPESGVAGALANWEVRDDGTVAPWLSFERHMKVLRTLYDHRPADLFPRLTVPLLLIWADTGDKKWSAGKREAMADVERAIPVARTIRMVGDHDLHAQQPEQLAGHFLAALEDGFFG